MHISNPDAFANLLLELLELHPEGLSEYDLLQRLRQLSRTAADIGSDARTDPHSSDATDMGLSMDADRPDDNHALFRTHFLLFHHLYRLRDRLLAQGIGDLEIHTLCIRKLSTRTVTAQTLAQPDPLRAYYLDLEQLRSTTREDVDQMLGRFWSRFSRYDRRHEALATLELDEDADMDSIRKQYRRLAMRHHPDRGGDQQRLQAINAAMAILETRGKG